jgi:hypothetical protein
MNGLLASGDVFDVPARSINMANAFMDARESADETHGIVALKKSRKVKDV